MSENSSGVPAQSAIPSPMPSGAKDERRASLMRFILGAVWMFLSFAMARGIARGVTGETSSLLQRVLEVAFLVPGFMALSSRMDRSTRPLRAIGFARRATMGREFGVGLALGWGMVVVLILPMLLAGRFHPSFFFGVAAWRLLLSNLLLLVIASLAEETAYRGYPYQKLIHAMGDAWGTVLMAVVFGLVHLQSSFSTMTSTVVTILGALLFSIAYLRTRALWLPWGLHMGWSVSLGLIFGLPVSGDSIYSSVVQTLTGRPAWLMGGDYGPEGSLVAVIVLVFGMVVLVRVTREFDWMYNAPVILPAGYPMDVAPPREHTRMEEEAAKPAPLVQILSSTPQGLARTDDPKP